MPVNGKNRFGQWSYETAPGCIQSRASYIGAINHMAMSRRLVFVSKVMFFFGIYLRAMLARTDFIHDS